MKLKTTFTPMLLFLLLAGACFMSTSAQKRTMSILGDSYSTFEGYLTPDTNAIWYFANHHPKPTDVDNVEQTWWHLFARENNLEILQNNSFSGATICYTGYRKEDYTNRSFLNRCDALGNPDMIFIFGGTNDSWAKAPIGNYNFGEKAPGECFAFRPALDEMLKKVNQLYPDKEIYFILNNELSEPITSSIESLCALYNIPVVRLRDIDKISSHPSVKGMRQIADQLTEFIGSYRHYEPGEWKKCL